MITYKNKKTERNPSPSKKAYLDKLFREKFESLMGEQINTYKRYGLYKSARILRNSANEFKVNIGGL
jgi:hypothetical protein